MSGVIQHRLEFQAAELKSSCVILQNECQVSLNTVENLETFLADINSGRWDQVLPVVAQLKLQKSKVEELYEEVGTITSFCNKLASLDLTSSFMQRRDKREKKIDKGSQARSLHPSSNQAPRDSIPNAGMPRSEIKDSDYMQVVLEMIELRETDTARAMLRQTNVFQRMRQDDPDRLLRLERLCNQTYFDIR